MSLTTGKKSKYAAKKARMHSGSYTGNSPFFTNIPEFQFLKPLHLYPHLTSQMSKRRKKDDDSDN